MLDLQGYGPRLLEGAGVTVQLGPPLADPGDCAGALDRQCQNVPQLAIAP